MYRLYWDYPCLITWLPEVHTKLVHVFSNMAKPHFDRSLFQEEKQLSYLSDSGQIGLSSSALTSGQSLNISRERRLKLPWSQRRLKLSQMGSKQASSSQMPLIPISSSRLLPWHTIASTFKTRCLYSYSSGRPSWLTLLIFIQDHRTSPQSNMSVLKNSEISTTGWLFHLPRKS